MVLLESEPDEVVGSGPWIREFHRRMGCAEAVWLDGLARFDSDSAWEADGQLSCVDWLTAFLGMGRATAFDKVRVAHELRRRPVLCEAFTAGRISYCALRAITRAQQTTDDVDAAMVAVAEEGTVSDVEAVVRAYRLYQAQEQAPSAQSARARGLRLCRMGDGTSKVEAILTEVEAEEVAAALRVVMERKDPGPQSSREDSFTGRDDTASWFELQADALMDLVRGGLGEWATGADRHMVHLVVRDGECRVLGGLPVDPGEMGRILCDCSHVTHVEDAGGAPLALGRRQRVWSAAQRRAVMVRDAGHCRWPGCRRTRVDLHHLVPWEDGGVTDIENAVALCPKHHQRMHAGFFTSGTAGGTLTFRRRSGHEVGTSRGGAGTVTPGLGTSSVAARGPGTRR